MQNMHAYILYTYAIYFCLLQNKHVHLLIQNAYKYSYTCNTVGFVFMAKYTHTHIFVYVDIYLFMQNMHIISYKYSSWELYSILCLVKKIYTCLHFYMYSKY